MVHNHQCDKNAYIDETGLKKNMYSNKKKSEQFAKLDKKQKFVLLSRWDGKFFLYNQN